MAAMGSSGDSSYARQRAIMAGLQPGCGRCCLPAYFPPCMLSGRLYMLRQVLVSITTCQSHLLLHNATSHITLRTSSLLTSGMLLVCPD